MENSLTLERYTSKGERDLSGFYRKLSSLFPGIEPQELPLLDSKIGGNVSIPVLINLYSLGENKSLVVSYYLNSVFYAFANSKSIKTMPQDSRIIEKIELIPKKIDISSQAKLERLIQEFS
jgi:hypothetical protein